MKLPSLLLLCATAAPCLAGCASSSLMVAPVGPGASISPVAASAEAGYVKVFTATHQVDVDFEAYFNPHSGYRVEDASGRMVKFVPNHSSDMDEAPDIVALPPGRYNIVAESTWYGIVTVPVLIGSGQTTEVHLDGRWRGGAQNAALVHLPNGETVGWCASEPSR